MEAAETSANLGLLQGSLVPRLVPAGHHFAVLWPPQPPALQGSASPHGSARGDPSPSSLDAPFFSPSLGRASAGRGRKEGGSIWAAGGVSRPQLRRGGGASAPLKRSPPALPRRGRRCAMKPDGPGRGAKLGRGRPEDPRERPVELVSLESGGQLPSHPPKLGKRRVGRGLVQRSRWSNARPPPSSGSPSRDF